GPGRDDNQFRGVQAAGHSVELDKAGSDSGDAASALVEFLNRLDRFHDLVLHGKHLASEPVFADGEDFLFHFVEQIVHFILFFVRASHALGGGGNDLTQDVFVANDLQVVLHICCGRNERKQVGDERGAADAVE